MLSVTAAACDWTSFGFDAAHTRATADPGPDLGRPLVFSHVWTGVTDGVVSSSPVTVDDTAFVTTSSGRLAAFTVAVGAGNAECVSSTVCAPKWTGALGAASTSTPTVDQGVVYAAADNGIVRAFDAQAQMSCGGSPRVCLPLWSTAPVGAIVGAPQIVGDLLYVPSLDGNLYVYDARGTVNCVNRVCSPRWRASMGSAIRSSPAVAAGRVYVGADDGRFAAFDAQGTAGCASGVCSALWSATTGARIQSSPAVAGGMVYIGADNGNLDAYDAAGTTNCTGVPVVCRPLWSASTSGPIVAAPAIADGRIVIGSDDGSVRAYDVAGLSGCTGTPRACQPIWQASLGSAVRGSPAIAAHTVFAGSTNGRLAIFDLAGIRGCTGTPLLCTPIWETELGVAVSAPAVSRARLFVGAGGLHAYRVVAAPASAGLASASLTAESDDVYGLSLRSGNRAVATAPIANVGGNTRIEFTRPADGTGIDLMSCATWTSDSNWRNQEGAALRVHPVAGGVKAITITKNIWFSANWIFNVHVWDSSRSPVATQIASFDLAATFFPNSQLRPFPWTLCAKVVGNSVSFVVWPSTEVQPSWDDPTHGGSVTLPAGFSDPGAAGWYIGHLEAGNRADFSGLSAGPILTGSGARSAPTITPREPTAIPNLP